jgi:hypothetical protein
MKETHRGAHQDFLCFFFFCAISSATTKRSSLSSTRIRGKSWLNLRKKSASFPKLPPKGLSDAARLAGAEGLAETGF